MINIKSYLYYRMTPLPMTLNVL